MLNIPIKITMQEVKDFPRDTLKVDDKWEDLIDPKNDHIYQRKRTRRKKEQICTIL